MSGPQDFEPTRPWSPDPPDRQAEPQPTPWWQSVRRHRPAAPDYSAQRQPPPYQAPPQQPVYPPYVQQPVQPYAAPAAGAVDQPKKSNRWPLIIALLVGGLLAVVVVAVAVLILAGNAHRKELDLAKAEAGVRQILTDPTLGYGVDNVTDVKCNRGDNPTIKKGETFSCDVSVNGAKRNVTVLFIDDNGTYEVDRPR
ncbi:MAG: DUF4333 domain-containing protein [Mycobacterium sp.]